MKPGASHTPSGSVAEPARIAGTSARGSNAAMLVPSITTAVSRCNADAVEDDVGCDGWRWARSSGARHLLQMARLIDIGSAHAARRTSSA